MNTPISSNQTRGSVFIEATIALPIFVFFVFAIFEFAMMAEKRSLLESVAFEGLSLSQTIAHLDAEDDPMTPEDEASLRLQAYERIEQRMQEFGENLLGENWRIEEVKIPGYPEPAASESRKSILEKEPIVIELAMDYTPGFPLSIFTSTIPIRATSSGYRELKAIPTQPVALDCTGSPIQPGSAPNSSGCLCPQSSDPNAYWNAEQNRCVCAVTDSEYYNDGTGSGCRCRSGFTDPNLEDEDLQCICAGADPFQCSGATGYLPAGSCSCANCGTNRVANAAKTGCICDPAHQSACLANPSRVYDIVNCMCVSCAGDALRSEGSVTTCQCTQSQINNAIATNTPLSWSTCAPTTPCTGQFSTVSSDGKGCICGAQPVDVTCRPGESWVSSSTTCGCACPADHFYLTAENFAGCAPNICLNANCSWDETTMKWVRDE